MMASCKQATELIEKREIAGLGIYEKVSLTYHLAICKACRAYQSQSRMIDDWIKSQQMENKNSEEDKNLVRRITDEIRKQQ